jgi:hypothetical protein
MNDPSGLCSICQIQLVNSGDVKKSDAAFLEPYIPNQIAAAFVVQFAVATAKNLLGGGAGRFRLRPSGADFPEQPYLKHFGLYDAVLPGPGGSMMQAYMFAYWIDYCNDSDGECLFQVTESGHLEMSVNGGAWKPAKGADLQFNVPDDKVNFDNKPTTGVSGPIDPYPADASIAQAPNLGELLTGPLKQPTPSAKGSLTCKPGTVCIRRAVLFDLVQTLGFGDPDQPVGDFNTIRVFQQKVKRVLSISDETGVRAKATHGFTFGRKNKADWGVQVVGETFTIGE